MRISKTAKAGSLESSDILIFVAPNENKGIELQLESIVIKQFGNQIRKTILDKLNDMEVDNITIKAEDRGALDCTIRARVETAVRRASD